MKADDISRETIFKILVMFIRINKKFNRIEGHAIDVGDGVRLYPSELHVIEAIGYNYAVNVTSLSRKFGITKGAVSQVVNKLFDKGFVGKERNRDYGKEIILSLTEKGWMAFDIQGKFHDRMEKEFVRYLEDFTADQINSFLMIMGCIEDYVDTSLSDELS